MLLTTVEVNGTPNHCKEPEILVDDDINSCASEGDLHPGCIVKYSFNVTSLTNLPEVNLPEVNLRGINLHQASVYVSILDDSILWKMCREKSSQDDNTHRVFECELNQSTGTLGVIILFDQGTGFSLCELTMLSYK